MVYSVLPELPLLFVMAGLALLGLSVALTRRAMRYRRGMQDLLLIGSKNLEPLDIPAAVWPVLVEAGWQHMGFRGDWFGFAVNSELTSEYKVSTLLQRPKALVFQIESGDDVQLALRMTHGTRWGDGPIFAEQMARVFVLLMEAALRVRTEAIAVALAERARLTLYLQHDMRNLAQWVGWVCADFSASTGQQDLLVVAARLQRNAPLAQERAKRLIEALGKNPEYESACDVDLGLAIRQAAHLAGVEVQLIGQANAWMAHGHLARVLDNLLSNLTPNWRESQTRMPLMQLQTVFDLQTHRSVAEVEFFSPWCTQGLRIAPEKLFEPFASGRSGGLGLGLYQARKSLREAGGELCASVSESGLGFTLRMPCKPV
jgi:signal transduction histidine kinase